MHHDSSLTPEQVTVGKGRERDREEGGKEREATLSFFLFYSFFFFYSKIFIGYLKCIRQFSMSMWDIKWTKLTSSLPFIK